MVQLSSKGFIMIAPVQSSPVAGSTPAPGIDAIRGLKAPNAATARPLLAQATAGSAVLSKAQVLELNPRWPGTAAASSAASANQIESIGRQLGNENIVSKPKTPDDTAVLLKPLRLANGIVLPVGTKMTGEAAPGAEGFPINQPARPMALKFELPNGSSIEFTATAEAKSGLGATNVEIVDKSTGKTTSAQFRSALFLDTKNNSLNFINGPSDGKFRVSDIRTQASGTASGAALGAALQKMGLGSL